MLAKKLSGATAAAAAYEIERSLRFNSADSAYLSRTFSTNGTSRKIKTFSFWVKRSANNNGTGQDYITQCYDGSSARSESVVFYPNSLTIRWDDGGNLSSSNLYRDYSAWYHVVIAIDTTQATASNRAKMYVNGVQITSFSETSYPSQNKDTQFFMSGSNNRIGSQWDNSVPMDAYLADFYHIDGQALTPSSFGEINASTGVWSPIEYTGSYGTNGFHLDFADNSGTTSTTLGKDTSGNSNNWTPNNFSVTAGSGNDSLVDTPTPYGTDTGAGGEVRGNYCTLNPLAQGGSMQAPTNGNLNISTTGSAYGQTLGTIAMPSGKWYWEVTPTTLDAVGIMAVGITLCTTDLSTYAGYESYSYVYLTDGRKGNNNSFVSYGASVAVNNVIGIAFDADAGTITFYKNGVSQGTAYSSIPSNNYLPTIGDEGLSNNLAGIFNFGQRPFAYTAPSGFKALCTQNLPAPTVVEGNNYFNTVTYTATGSTQSITGVGFQPDLVWAKSRSNSTNHGLIDAVRGVSRWLGSNTTDAEDFSSGNYLTAFNSDGFTVAGGGNVFGATNYTYAAWCWKANGAGSSNTQGSITSTVSVNTTAGFSIVTYTSPSSSSNQTVGHGLGVKPSLIIVKNRSSSFNWDIYHASLGYNASLTFTASTTRSGAFGAEPTSSVFTTVNNYTHSGTDNYVAYCFAPVEGFSAFGSYTGNGSADGPFVYTGFRPAFVLIKRTNVNDDNWWIHDSVRSPYNQSNNTLSPSLSDSEYTIYNFCDLTSNGFKLRSSNTATNTSGSNFIYIAFAENPFKHSLAR